jgi:hypothetical protein
MRLSTPFAFALAAVLAPLPAAAQLAVDEFSTDQSVAHSTTLSGTLDEISGLGILGGVRAIRLVQGGDAGALSAEVTGGELTMSTNTLGDLEMWWDGIDDDSFSPTGLGGLDLTSGGQFDRFLLEVTGNTLPGENMRMMIWIDGGNNCEVQFPMPVGMLQVPFASFTTCTGTATPVSASEGAGLIMLRTVFRPGAWTFSLAAVASTPVELLEFSID